MNENKPKRISYFTSIKCKKNSYKIDGGSLEPNSLTMLNKDFRSAYLKQITDLVYTEKDSVDFNKLLPVLVLYEFIKDDNVPVYIITHHTSYYKKYMVQALNKFFKEEKEVIEMIYELYIGKLPK